MVKKITLLFVLAIACSQLSFAQTANDISLLSAGLDRFSLPSVDNTISMEVKNNGTRTITSLEVSWSDGSTNHNALVKTNIAVGETATIAHPKPVNYSSIVEKNISVNISKANNSIDTRSADNSQSISFNTVTREAKKAVVIEEGTGTWCKWCPGGAVNIENMSKKYPETFIGIAIHNGDPMKFNSYNQSSGFRGYPSYHLDRAVKNVNIQGEWSMEGPYKKRASLKAPAELSATGSVTDSKATINAKATFVTKFARANYKLGVVVVENGVKGTSGGYAQKNAYAGGRNGKMGGYEKLPSTVPASKMTYDHVARALLGGYSGQSGSVIDVINVGDTAEYTFTYDIPSAYKKDNLHFIVLLLDGSKIVNGKDFSPKDLSSNEVSLLPEISMYPNPASENLNISFNSKESNDYEVVVYDMVGRQISSKKYPSLSGTQNISYPLSGLSNGNYLVSISTGKASYSKMIIVK